MTIFQKLIDMLDVSQRRQALLLLGLMLVAMALEMLGVGLIVPAFVLFSDSDIGSQYPMLEPVMKALGYPSQTWLIIGGMLSLVAVYIIRTMHLTYTAWRQGKFIFGVEASISQSLFAGYLRQPYAFHLQNNSAQLINNAVIQSNEFADGALGASMNLLAEALAFIGILTLLLIAEPLGTLLVMIMLGLAVSVFHKYSRASILRWGESRQYHEGMRIQCLQQGLGSAKDVKLLGREADFFSQYKQHCEASLNSGRMQALIRALPRPWLELFGVVGLAVLVIIMLVQGQSTVGLLPTLGLFAGASFRLLPSINRMIGSIHQLRYTLPLTNVLHAELALFKGAQVTSSKDAPPVFFAHNLQLIRIDYTYPEARVSALKDISLLIPKGSSVGIVGRSGAGKSTLVDIILGLLTPTKGQVIVDQKNICTNLRSWQDHIGYVTQSIYLTDDTLRRNVAFGLANDEIDEKAVLRAINSAQLNEFVNDLPDGLDTMLGECGIRLSGGQRQRIGIARALYHDPDVLVLDEATSALDTLTENEFMKAIRALRGEKTILIVSHRHSTVKHCDQLFRLERGCLVQEYVAGQDVYA